MPSWKNIVPSLICVHALGQEWFYANICPCPLGEILFGTNMCPYSWTRIASSQYLSIASRANIVIRPIICPCPWTSTVPSQYLCVHGHILTDLTAHLWTNNEITHYLSRRYGQIMGLNNNDVIHQDKYCWLPIFVHALLEKYSSVLNMCPCPWTRMVLCQYLSMPSWRNIVRY